MLPNNSLESEPHQLLNEIHRLLCEEMHKGNKQFSRVEMGNVRVGKPVLKWENISTCLKQHLLLTHAEVLFMGYQIDGGSDAEKDFLEALSELSALAKKREQRIKVRLCVNRKDYPASLVIRANQDNAFRRDIQFENLDIEYVEHIHKAFGSYHTKMIIIDGEIAIMPSAELLTASNYKDGESRQVDVASVLYGREFVKFLRMEFIDAWNNASCKPVKGNKSAIPVELSSAVEREFAHAVEAKAVYLAKKENGSILERKHLSPFALALTAAIKKAKIQVNLLTPNLNEDAIIIALADAHKNGVKINIVMGKHMNDAGESKPMMGGTNQNGIKKLFAEIGKRGGDPFNHIDVRWATDVTGSYIIPHPHPHTVHARVACVDGVVFVGSSVCDKQSVYHSKEADAIFSSALLVDLYLTEIFMPVFTKGINIFLDRLNEVKVVLPAEPNLSKLSIIYELNELRKSLATTPRWKRWPDMFPRGMLDKIRLKLVEELLVDIKKCDDLAAIQSLLVNYITENKAMTGSSKEEELGALHRILLKYTNTAQMKQSVKI